MKAAGVERWAGLDRAISRATSGDRRGSTPVGRAGDLVQQPPAWAGLAAGLALFGGARGRRAAFRGGVAYIGAAVVANLLVKPFVGRDRPPGAGRRRPGPLTSSFPSGHAATDVAFTIAASFEIPLLFLPLAMATAAAHWSLVRSRGHYASDVFVGGAIGVGVALAVRTILSARNREPATEPEGTSQL